MLVLTCDCGHQMKVAGEIVGRTVRCTSCRENVRVMRRNTESLDVVAARAAAASSAPGKRKIGQMLVDAGLITNGQLRDALGVQEKRGGKVVEQLVSLGHIDPDAFVRFLSSQPGVASLDLKNYRISNDIVSLIPVELAVKHEIFPIDRLGKLLTLGMVCPLDSATIARIEKITGLRVKPILCSPEDIRKCLRDYYPEHFGGSTVDSFVSQSKSRGSVETQPPDVKTESVETDAGKATASMKLQRAATLVSQVKTLPALPQTVQRVRAAMADVKTGANEVAEIIQHDPPIAAKVLQVANSAAYGFARKVDSVDLAVVLLGLRETASIVTSAALMNLLGKSEQYDYRQFWDEAMISAAAAREIGAASAQKNLSGLSTAGLLRDIGRIVLMELVPQQYAKVSADLVGDELVAAEQELLGIAHTEAGYELASNWSFPSEIAEPIRFHHSPEFAEKAKPQVAIVALAEVWTRTYPAAESDKDDVLSRTPELFEMLEMDDEAASAAYDAVAELGLYRFDWGEDT